MIEEALSKYSFKKCESSARAPSFYGRSITTKGDFIKGHSKLEPASQ
jgi:hypothetical protein